MRSEAPVLETTAPEALPKAQHETRRRRDPNAVRPPLPLTLAAIAGLLFLHLPRVHIDLPYAFTRSPGKEARDLPVPASRG